MHNFNYDVLKVSGADATSFLQGLISNDINITHNNTPIYTFILSFHGRYLFDIFINKYYDEYYIEVLECNTVKLLSMFNTYKLRKSVNVTHLHNLTAIYTDNPEKVVSSIILYRDPRYNKLKFRAIVDKIDVIEQQKTYIIDKYEYTIPDGEVDLQHGMSMVAEYGCAELNGVSYTKGCYLGQEVLARARTYGVMRKQIFKVIGRSALMQANIIIDNVKIGKICSTFGNVGIALVNSELLEQCKHQLDSSMNLKFASPPWRD